jgi:ketosteroid isomerase-like protein
MSSEGPSPQLGSDDDHAAVLAANQAFYDAFEARDLDAMSDLWAHDDRVLCVHPGWTALRGWASVGSSWAALFGGPQYIQFIVTDEHVVLAGDVAWVSCDENLLADDGSATVASLNLFTRDDAGSWKMLAHHGAPVMTGPGDDLDDED